MNKHLLNVFLFAVCTSATLAAQDAAVPAAPACWKDDFTGKPRVSAKNTRTVR